MPVTPELFENVTNEPIEVISDLPEKSDYLVPSGPVNLTVTPETSFNICLTCRYFRNGCSGPDLLLMELERIYEFLRTVQIMLGISNKELADGTKVSLSSIKRTLAGKEKNPRFSTLQSIARYLVGDPTGVHPCAMYLTEAEHAKTAEALVSVRADLSKRDSEILELKGENVRLSDALDKERKDHAADIAEHQNLQKQRYGYLKLKDRYIAITVALLSVSLIANLILAILL